MAKLSFVVLLNQVDETVEKIKKTGVKLIQEDTDVGLGYFTVEGSAKEIHDLREFLGKKK